MIDNIISTLNGLHVTWSVSKDSSTWLTLGTTSNGSNPGNQIYSVTANSGASRTCVLTFTQSTTGKVITVNIVQSAADVYVFTANGSDTYSYTFGNAGGNQSVNIVSTLNGSNHGWDFVFP